MIAPSPFSIVASKLRSVLATIPGLQETSIVISNPKNANVPTNDHGLNIFFFRVNFDGCPADGTSDVPFYVTAQCLITAYGVEENVPSGPGGGGAVKITPGENDLRLIGEVMRVLHEKPVLIVDSDGKVMHLQVVMLPLSLDEINHLWSTQGDTVYRFSVAYELSLIPVPFDEVVQRSPLVTSVGVDVFADTEYPELPESGFDVTMSRPPVTKLVIDVKSEEWSPHICFLEPGDTLSYAIEIPDTTTEPEIRVLMAGAEGTELQFYWKLWRWDLTEKSGGWGKPVLDENSPSVVIPAGEGQEIPIFTNIIDPDNIDGRLVRILKLPVTLPPASNIRYQAVLYAVRKKERLQPFQEPLYIDVISNTLAISIFPEPDSP